MPLTKDTLELILDQAGAATALPSALMPLTALPVGVKIHNLEQFQAGRLRFRGSLHTNSLRDFAEYTISRNGPAARGFIDQDNMSCQVFFNLGTDAVPGHADDTATLKLKPTAAYKALQEITGRKLNQRELAEWIEDWNASLVATKEGGGTMPISAAVASVRNITIEARSSATSSEHNFGAARSAMENIEAANAETRIEALHFSLTPYDGLGTRVFTLKLSILTGDDKPTLKLRWAGEEQQIEEIAQEFKTTLVKEVGGTASLILGTFNA
ncbi:YfdQ family protein [Pseudomonas sp. MG-9]|uniref:DUF2303 family protein n=1 Tax=Pseudomonas sp. MG-9 TaxID=2839032 RepID=UPI001C0049AE|nr:DUF2303 family protein [Pseudomonas sp. MG-9]MBT9263557.1 YfdQ family protein [Pseudomonas sp. MG-9]